MAISERTRKRLWTRANDTCAYPGCGQSLLFPVEGGDEDTIVGHECHNVATSDDHWRGVNTLIDEEKRDWAHLIADRDGYSNLVLMCVVHHAVIDDPNQGWRVADVDRREREHEERAYAERPAEARRRDAIELRYAAILDEWVRRVELDLWRERMSGLLWEGWPRMRRETQQRLREAATWLFGRVWPGELVDLERRFENFRLVWQDLDAVFSRWPHPRSDDEVVYLDNFGGDMALSEDPALLARYEFFVDLVEDLTLELTRAANHICDGVRNELNPTFRLEEGLVLIESGPYFDLSTRTHRVRYAPDAPAIAYPGVEAFLTEREQRDTHFGKGGPPPHTGVPGVRDQSGC